MFQGYTQQTVDFLWGLRLNNERSWFLPRKEEFLVCVDTPTRELARELTGEMTRLYPRDGLVSKVSRIYRDARRLYGRGPYKDHLWFTLRRPAEHEGAVPCFFFEVAPDRYSYGIGCWDPTPLTMAKLRARISRDPDTMTRLMRKLNRQREFVLETEDYKRPRSQAPSRLLEPWYRARTFTICHSDKLTDELFGRDIVEHLKEGFTFLLPYYDYFVTLDGDPDPRDLTEEKGEMS